MEVENLIILVCTTLLLSFISSLIYRLTKIPDVIWLMGFGILMGSGIQYVDKALFNELAPLMSILALSIILFEAGINLDIITLIDNLGKSTILTLATVLSSIILVGIAANKILPQDFTLLQGMLLGAMVGGTSTVAVFGVLSSIEKIVPNCSSAKIMLTMESIISDPVCIIASITLIKMILHPGTSIRDGVSDIVSSFILSTILGLAIGLSWSTILNRLRNHPHTYMISLAILLPSYIVSEHLIGEGSGAMTALVFGLSITNFNFIMDRLGRAKRVRIDIGKLRSFHEEIVFFIKSFFFVYIGVVVSLSWKFFFVGFSVVILLVVMRYLVASGLGGVLRFTREELSISRVVFATGLPSFVMAQLPQIYDPRGSVFLTPGIYPDICMPIVLGTILFSGIVGPWMISNELELVKRTNGETISLETDTVVARALCVNNLLTLNIR
ncbi:cation:proton antiporter, partial [Candidatus Bathyarchaeota archaeon]|nr:cation:proton antiporter [Candidatus Bathyarchaeota archaeon]